MQYSQEMLAAVQIKIIINKLALRQETENLPFRCRAFVEISWRGNTEGRRQETRPNSSSGGTARHKTEIRRKRNKIGRRENIKKKSEKKNARRKDGRRG